MKTVSQKPLLISIVGPTAIGKTTMAIALAKHFKTEIISADSRQFFKEMHIGTAVPTPEELNEAPHHFIQQISVVDNYTVGDFERDALSLLETLFKKNKVVIMVGGSGLYADAVTKGLDEFPAIKEGIREKLNDQLETEGIEALQRALQKADPVYYKEVDLQNPHRLIRALEVIESSGKTFSSYRNQQPKARFFETVKVGLTADREIIYDRINRRVDIMMQEGLLQEVKGLLPFKELNALQTVGYRELIAHLETEQSLEQAVAAIKQNTRRFAKRQLTWFRKDQQINWFDYLSPVTAVIDRLKELYPNLDGN